MYHEITIKAHHAGFGMYETTPDVGDGWADVDDLIAEMRSGVDELLELGVDELPEEVEDIRGKIYNQPARVFACKLNGEWFYTGIIGLEG